MSTVEMAARIGLGLALGAAVGLERQWRSRMAGVRTNALVSLGATLFVLLGAYSFDGPGADPTRVAAQIVSGIGFLGAGVIMKQGSSVTGLNTAATLWAAAAVGALAGTGMYWVAVIGAAGIMLVNTALRPVSRLLDHIPSQDAADDSAEYVFEVSCRRDVESHVREVLSKSVQRHDLRLKSLRSRQALTPGEVTIVAELSADEPNDKALTKAINRLSAEPMVTGLSWDSPPHRRSPALSA
ncbi:MgtC/SapB family protein [Rhodococcus olei]|uniref:MgtC/SapB family protein n=1 Tax=Rhodococcus olei TaxID=2161675 RepID=A0ABP8P679_9NOCA